MQPDVAVAHAVRHDGEDVDVAGVEVRGEEAGQLHPVRLAAVSKAAKKGCEKKTHKLIG